MDNRNYSRIIVDVPSCIYITLNDYTKIDIEGIIHDISESGIQVRVNSDSYDEMAKILSAGDVISFQAVDEYNVLNENKVDIVGGVAEVIWLNVDEKEIVFGCRTNKVLPEYLSYVKQKKLSLFFSGKHDIKMPR